MAQTKARTKRSTTKPTTSAETWRDDAKVRARLFGDEVRDQLEKLEKDWVLLRSIVKSLGPEAKQAAEDSGKALKPLLSRLQTSVSEVLDGVKRHHRKAA